MKKFILLLSAMFLLLGIGNAQTEITSNVSGAKFLPNNQYGYYWGTTADTLKASATKTLVLRVKGEKVRDLSFATELTDSITGNFIFYKSMNGVLFEATGDTIKYANVMATKSINLDDYSYPYLKVTITAGGGTDDSKLKLYYISRDE